MLFMRNIEFLEDDPHPNLNEFQEKRITHFQSGFVVSYKSSKRDMDGTVKEGKSDYKPVTLKGWILVIQRLTKQDLTVHEFKVMKLLTVSTVVNNLLREMQTKAHTSKSYNTLSLEYLYRGSTH